MSLKDTVVILLAIWPVMGVAVLALVGRLNRGSGEAVLPPANGVSEVLTRMYLWPIVLWRIRLGRRQMKDE
jgi:hypothetical protein